MATDGPYCAARTAEERRLANASAHGNVRRVHCEMATRYADAADVGALVIDELRPETELLTAWSAWQQPPFNPRPSFAFTVRAKRAS